MRSRPSADRSWSSIASPRFSSISHGPGRHLWVAVYFKIDTGSLKVQDLSDALDSLNEKAREKFQECTCELILVP